MPTYGYRCNACGTEFERFQKMTDPPVTDCECGATGSVKKLIFPVGIQFKGSGFYVNDYTGAGKEPAVKSEPSENKSEAKSETTSASSPSSDSATTSNNSDSATAGNTTANSATVSTPTTAT
jgi:putative FmdB family regulatory protein